MEINIRRIIAGLLFILVLPLYASGGQMEEGKSLKDQKKEVRLTAPKVIEYLLRNNYDVKRALLDYKSTGTGLLRFRSAFDYKLYGTGDYSRAENNNGNNPTLSAKSYSNINGTAGISNYMRSGTTISAGLSASRPHYEQVTGTGENLSLYQSGVNISLSQELLKNSFGLSDRLTEQKIANTRRMTRDSIRSRLAGLLADALIGYWNIAIAEENLKTAEVSLKSTVNIRNLIIRKSRLGLSEKEEILDWNGKVLEAQSRREQAEKLLFDARLGIIRTLNLESGIDLIVGKTFKTTAPEVTYEQSLRDAFLKRTDWNNQKIAMKNAGIDYRISSNGELPSLKLKAGYGNNTYDTEGYAGTVSELNPEYSLGFEFNYPLNSRSAEADMRDARIGLQTRQIEMKNLESEIRDDVLSRVKQCSVDYSVYVRTSKTKDYALGYYNQVYNKFRRGRYSALELKAALDSYILSRQAELKSLVDYNISLLRRDLARNVIFDNYGIDIDSILKRVEN